MLEKALDQAKGDPLLSKVEQEISTSLERITPFRILDLLSRDMDETIRDQGITLLQAFISKRGGLDDESNVIMEDSEFKSFFRQIRYFLTVQEQIDLFQTTARVAVKTKTVIDGANSRIWHESSRNSLS